MNSSSCRVAVLGGVRIPFARQDGPYARASNQDMLTASLDALVDAFGLEDETLGEVAAGAVLKHSRDFNLTRECVLGSRLAPETPAYDVQQACATGLEAMILVANKIALGQIDAGVAGGVDTTSDAPIAVNEDLRDVLLEANRAKSNTARLRALAKIRPQQIVPAIPRNEEPRTGLSMGEHAAITAREWGIAREEQDELAVRSHHNLAAAYDTRLSRRPRDPVPRPRARSEPAAGLEPREAGQAAPVFGGDEGTMTAGNSTPLTDGASAVLLASEEWAAGHGMPVQAYIAEAQTAAVDYVHKREGLLMAPAYAMPKMLERAGLSLQDFDFYEIHEAFAAQVLCTLKAWEDPVFCRERLGLERAARFHRSGPAQRPRRLARRWPSVRGHRRAHRRQPGQDARPRRAGPRA